MGGLVCADAAIAVDGVVVSNGTAFAASVAATLVGGAVDIVDSVLARWLAIATHTICKRKLIIEVWCRGVRTRNN